MGYHQWSCNQGQVTIESKQEGEYSQTTFDSPTSAMVWQNNVSMIPIANVFTGAIRIINGICMDASLGQCSDVRILPGEMWKFRAICILTGVAEITLVGGWMLHGGTTLYFYITKPTDEERRHLV